ncbi:MAG TPA: hypothetical protein VM939_05440, partial [Gemmatimonadaceae bacterium]|nr:hypothetical protein [Gemmatimonadaceae bacterium]
MTSPSERDVATRGHHRTHTPMHSVLMVIASVVLCFLAMLVLVWWRQERITFQPPAPPFDNPVDVPRVVYSAADGAAL